MFENKDVIKDYGLCDVIIGEKQNIMMLNKFFYSDSYITLLLLYKKGNYSNISILKFLIVNFNLDVLLLVFYSEKKIVKYICIEYDFSIYGKVVVLYGFQQNIIVLVF